MPDLSLSVLGPCRITLDGRPINFRTTKVQALLCYLAVETAEQPGIAFRRVALMALLWPEMPLKSAQDNLRQTLYQLRKAIPKTATGDNHTPQPFILSDRLTIQLNPACRFHLDTAAFQQQVGPAATLAQMEAAAALYRGDFLADFYLPDNSEFEEWAAAHRLKYRNQVLVALDKLAAAHTKQGQFDKARSFAGRQLALDNLRESAHRQLMTILFGDGRRAEALQQYEKCRQLLLDELGVEPSAKTTALYQQILTGKSPIEPSTFRPALAVSFRHNLPAPATSFVGRHRELAELINRLSDQNCRLLTLLGPGGTGKTRLALQAASIIAREEQGLFPDGVFMVWMAAVSSIDYLIPAIAEAVGFSFSGSREPQKQLVTYLKSKKLLLVLDNMEHLAGSFELLSDMLTAVPGLTFLATSRARLNLYEEWRFEVIGLEVPDEEAADLENYSAVQLFIQRARQAGIAKPAGEELPAIGLICQLLSGMPLAIELAAGWLRSYTCQQIAAEIERGLDFLTTTLQNVPERHRSLQVAFEHSWQLLPAEAQQIFRQATVFRGGFGREAAEFVTGASAVSLAVLVDNSMLQASDGRFHINELLRQFGAEKLSDLEKANVHQFHARYYADFLEAREQARWTAEEPATLGLIRQELKNILAGWHWTVSQLAIPDGVDESLLLINRCLPMLVYFYEKRSRFHEGIQLCMQASEVLSAIENGGDKKTAVANILAQVKTAEAYLRFHLGQYSIVESLLGESLATFHAQDDHLNTATALLELGMTYNRLGSFGRAKEYLAESLSLFRDKKTHAAEALHGLGIVAISEERFEEGEAILNECLTIYKEAGYTRGIARALSNLGTAAVRSGKFKSALPLYEAALTAARTINDPHVIAVVLSNLGSTSCVLGNYEASLGYYEESLVIFREMGEQRWIAVDLNGLGEALIGMGQMKAAEANLRQSLEISTAIHSTPDSLDCLAALGEISADSGNVDLAVRLLTFVVQHPVAKPLARARAEKILDRLKKALGPDMLESAVIAGQQETLVSLTEQIMNS